MTDHPLVALSGQMATDAARAKTLMAAISWIEGYGTSDQASSPSISVTVNFAQSVEGRYQAEREIEQHMLAAWSQHIDGTLSHAKAELAAIEAKYAALIAVSQEQPEEPPQ